MSLDPSDPRKVWHEAPSTRETQFQRLLDCLPAAAYTCDASGLITYFNEPAVELWGRAPQLNDGRPLLRVF